MPATTTERISAADYRKEIAAPSYVPKSKGEAQQQAILFRWLTDHEAQYQEFRWIYGSLNGIYLNVPQKCEAKRMGLRRGAWDVSFLKPSADGQSRSLFVELKFGRNPLTDDQNAFRDAHEGCTFVVARSWIEAARAILDHLGIADEHLRAELSRNDCAKGRGER